MGKIRMSQEVKSEALGEEVVGHKPLGVYSGTFHSKSQHRKQTFTKALVSQETRVEHEATS